MGKGSVRMAGVAGIIFVLLIAIPGFASGSPPDPGDPASKFLSYYQDHRSAFIAVTFLAGAADFFVVFFIGGLLSALRRLGAAPLLIVASLTALILTGALATAGGLMSATAAFRVGESHHVDAETIRLLADGSAIAFTLLGFTLAAFLASTGLMIAGARQFPIWLSWIAGIGAVLELVGTVALFGTTGAFSPEGFVGVIFGLLPFAVFMLAVSIVMVVRNDAIEGAMA